MVANSSNLIITVKPANQRTTLTATGPRRGSFSRNSNVSHNSLLSHSSTASNSGGGVNFGTSNANFSDSGEHDHDEEDEIRDLTSIVQTDSGLNHRDSAAYSSTSSANNNSRKPILHLWKSNRFDTLKSRCQNKTFLIQFYDRRVSAFSHRDRSIHIERACSCACACFY